MITHFKSNLNQGRVWSTNFFFILVFNVYTRILINNFVFISLFKVYGATILRYVSIKTKVRVPHPLDCLTNLFYTYQTGLILF